MKNVIKADLLSSRDSSTLTSSFKTLTTYTFAGPVVILRIVNDSDKGVIISYDGVTNHDYVMSETTLLLNFQSNSAPNNRVAMIRKDSGVWVKGTAGTGNIYLAAYYLES